QDRPHDRAAHAERAALPEHRTRLVDDARRVDHGAGRNAIAERSGDPERNEPPLRHAVRRGEAEARGRTEPPRDPLLRFHRAGEGQPVSVQAMLRTVSFTLPVAAKAADGSKPEWMPQCSQRGSLPGPYSSHSIPSRSDSYVGKIPSVSR